MKIKKKVICIGISMLFILTALTSAEAVEIKNDSNEVTDNILSCSGTVTLYGDVWELGSFPRNYLEGVKVERIEPKVYRMPIFGYNVIDGTTTLQDGSYKLFNVPRGEPLIIRFSKPGYVTIKEYLTFPPGRDITYELNELLSEGKSKSLTFISIKLFQNFPLLNKLTNI